MLNHNFTAALMLITMNRNLISSIFYNGVRSLLFTVSSLMDLQCFAFTFDS